MGEQSEQLFTALAEQLRVPLLQIARLSEQNGPAADYRIPVISEQALRLIEGYLQANATTAQASLALEPLTTGAVLYDVAAELLPMAKNCQVDLDINCRGQGLPIMAPRQPLKTILSLIATSLISACSQTDTKSRVVLGSHRSSLGIVTGVFSPEAGISERSLELVRRLHGRAAQSMPQLTNNGGVELAIADMLCRQISLPLKSHRHDSLSGLGTTLLPSRQLSLV